MPTERRWSVLGSGESSCNAYESSKAVRKLGVVVQGFKIAGSVFVYEECHVDVVVWLS